MLSSIGLTISGLIFTFLIAIIYFSKPKYKNVENTLYSFLLMFTIFLLLLELYCVFSMRIRHIHPILNEIFCRIYILGAIIWVVTIYIYTTLLGNQDDYKTLKDLFKNKFVIFLVAITPILFISSCFMPVTYTSGIHNELYVIGGEAVTVLYIISLVVGLFLIIKLFKNKSKTSLFKRLPVIFFIVIYAGMFIFQYLYTDINDLTFMFGLTVVAIYFTIVSQDYKLVSELETETKRAKQANKEKTDFLSKMSHEIRTPMNAIMGFSESLMNDPDLTEDKVLDDVKNIYIAGNNLISTINNILDVSKIESGKEIYEEAKYSLGDLVFDLQSYIEARIDQTKVKFIIDFDENIPVKLLGDKNKIYKVLLNILSNSARYTTSGEIRLKIEAVCDKGFADLKFVISDTGIGIKEEDFNKVFIKFAKLETDIKDLERGAGLGLNIAKSLTEIMGGKILFESEYNVGTTFTILLKNRIVDYHKSGNIIAKRNVISTISKKIDCSGKRIMVVDDNKLNLKVVDNLLRSYNFDVTLVESGETCIEIIKKKEKFDLLLLDNLMPDLNGIDTIRIIKKLKDYDIPPIIALSSNVTNELKQEFIKEGFSGFLTKPLDIKKINGLVEYYFKK